ncbi:MAG: hypothetical protein ABSC04_19975 [Syntrophobacteraceae bacterium]|jgi:outer membrane murein-binding lipoprotein Lpp
MKSLPRQNRHVRWLILCGLMIAGSLALANDISGIYVGRGSNIAVLIQIVQTNDRQLTGRYEQVSLQPNGKLDDLNATITGATNGQTVVVTIKPNEFLARSFAVSGTFEGRLLHLTGGGYGSNLNLNLLKSDEADFRSQVAMLTNQANQLIETRERQEAEKSAAEARERIEQQKINFIAGVDKLIQSMQDKNMRIDKVLEYLLQQETQYHAITSKIHSYLERVLSLSGDRNGVLRNQVIVAMNDEVVNTNGININVQSIVASYFSNLEPLLNELAEAMHSCPAQDETVNAACQKLHDPGEAFRAKCKAEVDVLNRLEKTYQTELAAQQAMISKAGQVR